MKPNTKLIEIIVSELDAINEIGGAMQPNATGTQIQQPQQQQPVTQQRIPSDVQSLSRANSNAQNVQRASTRINTVAEFPEAFRVWFQSLGYKPENRQISIMKVKSEVERIMKEMGFR